MEWRVQHENKSRFELYAGVATQRARAGIMGIQTTPESEPYFFTSNDIHTNTLNRVFYLSDNEIWFNFFTAEGRGALVCFDINGDYVGTLNVAIDGEYPSIMCINHVSAISEQNACLL